MYKVCCQTGARQGKRTNTEGRHLGFWPEEGGGRWTVVQLKEGDSTTGGIRLTGEARNPILNN